MHHSLINQACALYQQCFTDQKTVKAILQSPDTISLTTKFKDKLVGFVVGRIVLDEAEIFTLAVSPEWRRKRIARKLIKDLLNEFTKRKVNLVFLEVVTTNQEALRLYKSFGFYKVGTRKAYYNHSTDAHIFKKDLT